MLQPTRLRELRVLGLRALIFAVVAIAASQPLRQCVRMFEFLAFGSELREFGAAALRKNRVASVAVAGRDFFCGFANCFVLIVVATEASGPIFVANVLGVLAPVSLHVREEIFLVDIRYSSDGLRGCWQVAVLFAQSGVDRGGSFGFCGVGFSEEINDSSFRGRQFRIDFAEIQRAIDGFVG